MHVYHKGKCVTFKVNVQFETHIYNSVYLLAKDLVCFQLKGNQRDIRRLVHLDIPVGSCKKYKLEIAT